MWDLTHAEEWMGGGLGEEVGAEQDEVSEGKLWLECKGNKIFQIRKKKSSKNQYHRRWSHLEIWSSQK